MGRHKFCHAPPHQVFQLKFSIYFCMLSLQMIVILIILDDTNYTIWAQFMRSFLKGSKLWLYMIGDLPKPINVSTESYEAFCNHLLYSESNHHHILTWFCRNTTTPSIGGLFGLFDDYKSSWLVSCYSLIGGSRAYAWSLSVDLWHFCLYAILMESALS